MQYLFNTRIVETVYEDSAYGWIYRFVETGEGVIVKRTPLVPPVLWSHNVITQVYDQDAQRFIPICECGFNLRFSDMDTAENIVEDFVFSEQLG